MSFQLPYRFPGLGSVLFSWPRKLCGDCLKDWTTSLVFPCPVICIVVLSGLLVLFTVVVLLVFLLFCFFAIFSNSPPLPFLHCMLVYLFSLNIYLFVFCVFFTG